MTAMVLLSTWMESQVEFWRKTKYEGYDVSSFGRTRSFWKRVHRRGHAKGYASVLTEDPVIIYGGTDGSGYNYLNLGARGCPKVHRLVGQAFIPNPEHRPEINHKTGIKRDNRVDNLEWVTKKQNMRHAAAIGLRNDILPKGSAHYRAKLTDAKVVVIRARYASGDTFAAIARDYQMDASTIGDICYRRRWKHVA